jgi:protein arginine kinase
LLKNTHVIASDEALNLLSFIRLAVDFGMLPEANRADVDRLVIESQPGHVQYAAQEGIAPEARDIARADKLRQEFSNLPALAFDKLQEQE